MFEGFLEKFLLKYFGEYLKGIDKQNLSVAVWKGEIAVKTVDINPEILKKAGIPLKMIFGKIESLLLKVPWNNLSGKPVEVEIDSISMVLLLEDIALWYSNQSYLEFCMALIDGVKDEMSKKLEEEFEKQDKKSSFFEQIFDNLMVSVKNIHVRIENTMGYSYCFGGVLENFSMKSVDSTGKSIFVKRSSILDKVTKMISFTNLILYHDTKVVGHKDVNIIDYYFKSCKIDMHRIINLTLDIIFTVSPYNKEDQSLTTPIYHLSTDISNIRLNFNTPMIRDITTLLDYFTTYKNNTFE
jgi:vacuolar protein sorting-associated protein 13A/C